MREYTLEGILENLALLPKVHRTAHRDIVKVALEALEEGLTRSTLKSLKYLMITALSTLLKLERY